MPADEKALFLDTNVLLHYPLVKDVDWKGVCETKTVRLVLCMQVVHELDTKKDDGRLGDRARREMAGAPAADSPPRSDSETSGPARWHRAASP